MSQPPEQPVEEEFDEEEFDVGREGKGQGRPRPGGSNVDSHIGHTTNSFECCAAHLIIRADVSIGHFRHHESGIGGQPSTRPR